MKLQQIDHLALTCRAPEVSKDWYVTVLGFEHVHASRWKGVPLFLKLGSTYLALFPHRQDAQERPGTGPRLDHFALRAATYADFKDAQDRLIELGITFAFQDHELAHSIYFSDPDGNRVEITTYDLQGRV